MFVLRVVSPVVIFSRWLICKNPQNKTLTFSWEPSCIGSCPTEFLDLLFYAVQSEQTPSLPYLTKLVARRWGNIPKQQTTGRIKQVIDLIQGSWHGVMGLLLWRLPGTVGGDQVKTPEGDDGVMDAVSGKNRQLLPVHHQRISKWWYECVCVWVGHRVILGNVCFTVIDKAPLIWWKAAANRLSCDFVDSRETRDSEDNCHRTHSKFSGVCSYNMKR